MILDVFVKGSQMLGTPVLLHDPRAIRLHLMINGLIFSRREEIMLSSLMASLSSPESHKTKHNTATTMLDNWYKVLMEYSIWFPPEIHGHRRLKTSIFCSSTHRSFLHKSGEFIALGCFCGRPDLTYQCSVMLICHESLFHPMVF
uniref:Uncharacterized protein n=1 Tax=Micrurus corallinus TaxID=54390 RepID=A0A2D4FPS8_MICCO